MVSQKSNLFIFFALTLSISSLYAAPKLQSIISNDKPSKNIQKILAEHQSKILADEVAVVIMKSDTGELVAVASSRAEAPFTTEKQILQSNAVIKTYEPSSSLFPIILALELNKELKIDLGTGFDDSLTGTFIDKLRDDDPAEKEFKEKFEVQITKKLNPMDIYGGLTKFGYSQKIGLESEEIGYGEIFSLSELEYPQLRGIVAIGYGQFASLMQHVKAYNVFNNQGTMLTPKIPNATTSSVKSEQIINLLTAAQMKSYLKDRSKNDFSNTDIGKLEVGGVSSWTIYSDDKNKSLDKTNATFVGFINDGKSKYTIGITAFNAKSTTKINPTIAIAKDIIKMMEDQAYLKK